MAVESIVVRPFEKGDEAAMAEMIAHTLRVSNRDDYTPEYLEGIVNHYPPEFFTEHAEDSHLYVLCDGERIIGCGGITGCWGSTTESYVFSVFVHPDYQGHGLGKMIMDALESDDFFRRAARTELASSITATGFYQKLGYAFIDGITTPDEAGVIKMEKKTMTITYEKKEALTFIGFHTGIAPGEGYQKCPEFWEKEYAAKYARLWQTMKPETPVEEAILAHGIGMFAFCADAETGFEYWIAGLYKGGEVPAGLELYTFPASNWAMFSIKGPIPSSLHSLNTFVWQEWFPTEGKRLHANGLATLEVYSAGNPQSPFYESGIWVPIAES